MKHGIIKLGCSVLAAALLCGSLTACDTQAGNTASAPSGQPTVQSAAAAAPVSTEAQHGSVVDSGVCGDDLRWVLYSDGALIISGTGAMNSADYLKEHTLDIKKLIVENGATTLYDGAFMKCTNLTEVSLPGSLTEIGSAVFFGCTNLGEINIPEGVTSIGELAFQACSSLKTANLPSTLTTLGGKAFLNCGSLTSMVLPEGLTEIGEITFNSCTNLKEITIPGSVVRLGDNCFTASGIETIYYTGTSEQWQTMEANSDNYDLGWANIVFSDGVRGGTSGSCGDNVTWQISKEGVLTISGNGDMTSAEFTTAHHNEIKKIIVEEGVTSIADEAFKGFFSLGSVSMPSTLREIGKAAFRECEIIQSIKIPESVTSIGEEAFSRCTNLKEVTLPSGLETLSGKIFSDCSALEKIDLPQGLKEIGGGAFSGCESIREITIPDSVTTIATKTKDYEYGAIFEDCTNLREVKLSQALTDIPERTFDGCSNLQEIKIPDNVTYIKGQAFCNCESLTSITLPQKLEEFDIFTFSACPNLSKIYYPGTQAQWNSVLDSVKNHYPGNDILVNDTTPIENIIVCTG